MRHCLFSFLMLASLLLPLSTQAQDDIYIVSNLNDSGDGSLREAIEKANDSPNAATINFLSSVWGESIYLESPLPAIQYDLTLDASASGATPVYITGSESSDWSVVFVSATGSNAFITLINVAVIPEGTPPDTGTGGTPTDTFFWEGNIFTQVYGKVPAYTLPVPLDATNPVELEQPLEGCLEGEYRLVLRLSVSLEEMELQEDWVYTLPFDLLNDNGDEGSETHPSEVRDLSLSVGQNVTGTGEQRFQASYVYPGAISCQNDLEMIHLEYANGNNERFTPSDALGENWEDVLQLEVLLFPMPAGTFVDAAANETMHMNLEHHPCSDDEHQPWELSWEPTETSMQNAVAYDIEWVYLDSEWESFFLTEYGDETGAVEEWEVFDFVEPTRVTVRNNSSTTPFTYGMDLLYPSGRVFFRIRGVGVHPDNRSQRVVGRWHYHRFAEEGLGETEDPPLSVRIGEEALPADGNYFQEVITAQNWQAVTTYAEEGKYKKVLSFYDGSLRNRQTQTNLSTSHSVLIAETLYDQEGRGVFNVLPVPEQRVCLGYQSNYNVFNGSDKGKAHYDNASTASPTLQTTKGASKFYSENNGYLEQNPLGKNDEADELVSQYIPDAKGYPYTQVEYLNDNTGRVRKQSGVGETFRLRTSTIDPVTSLPESGRVTQYYYATPSPEELHALFGVNVGENVHYKKQMVVDPNGQVSVSYLDQEGRVIATALAGASPDNLEALPSLSSQEALTHNIMGRNRIQEEALSSRMEHIILNQVEFEGGVEHNFDYNLDFDAFPLAYCVLQNEWMNPTYRLRIWVVDEDNNPVNLHIEEEDGVVIDDSEADVWVYEKDLLLEAGNPDFNFQVKFSSSFTRIGDYKVVKELKLQVPSDLRSRLLSMLEQGGCGPDLAVDCSVCGCYEYDEEQGVCVPATDCEVSVEDAVEIAEEESEDAQVFCESAQEEVLANFQSAIEGLLGEEAYRTDAVSNDLTLLLEDLDALLLASTAPVGTDAEIPTLSEVAIENLFARMDAENGLGGLADDFFPPEVDFSNVSDDDLENNYPYRFQYKKYRSDYFCQYIRCQYNAASQGYDLMLNALSDLRYTAAEEGNLTRPLLQLPTAIVDPYFVAVDGKHLEGADFYDEMQEKLDKEVTFYISEGVASTDASLTAFMAAFDENDYTRQLYASDIYDTYPNADTDAEEATARAEALDKRKWILFVQTYLSKKSEIKHEIAVAYDCVEGDAGAEANDCWLTAIENGEGFEDCPDSIEESETIEDEATEEDAGARVTSLTEEEATTKATEMFDTLLGHCGSLSSSAIPTVDQDKIKTGLTNYFLAVSEAGEDTFDKIDPTHETLQFEVEVEGITNTLNIREYLELRGSVDCDFKAVDTRAASTEQLATSMYNLLLSECQALDISSIAPEDQDKMIAGLQDYILLADEEGVVLSYFDFEHETLQFEVAGNSLHLVEYIIESSNLEEESACDFSDYNIEDLEGGTGTIIRSVPQTVLGMDGTSDAQIEGRLSSVHALGQYDNLVLNHEHPEGTLTSQMTLNFQLSSQEARERVILYLGETSSLKGSFTVSINSSNQLEAKWYWNNNNYTPVSAALSGTLTDYILTEGCYELVLEGVYHKDRVYYDDTQDHIDFPYEEQEVWESLVLRIRKAEEENFQSLTLISGAGELAFKGEYAHGGGLIGSPTIYLDNIPANSSLYLGNYPDGLVGGNYALDGAFLSYSQTATFTLNPESANATTTTGAVASLDFSQTSVVGSNEYLATGSGITSVEVICLPPVTYPYTYVHPAPEGDDNCYINAVGIAERERNEAINELISAEFLSQRGKYILHGLGLSTNAEEEATMQENFTYSALHPEYHYTLYYYDQAGNLVQTVPPKGVQTTGTATNNPAHTFKTQYAYNSLNQLVWQQTPDGGESQFWYDDKGMMRLSQNAQQAVDKEYSYTKYDEQGRITEVGQAKDDASAINDLITNEDETAFQVALNNSNFPSGSTYELREITRTQYDDLGSEAVDNEDFTAENLRGRVAWVQVENDEFKGNTAPELGEGAKTLYSYDEHGNVKSLLQVLPDLESKLTQYQYDLVSGNVNYVHYQPGKEDQFIHAYEYDADNRLKSVETSVDGLHWNQDAEYYYYPHGPLAWVKLGEYTVQKVDYFYTLQGWLKGVNAIEAGSRINEDTDLNRDGTEDLKDAFSYTLGYYEGDYEAISPPTTGLFTSTAADDSDNWTGFGGELPTSADGSVGLYNGNIAWMTTDLKNGGLQGMAYRYDQLNRIKAARSFQFQENAWGAVSTAYATDYEYDGNGNLLALNRNDGETVTSNVLHQFTYNYETGNNRLNHVADASNHEDALKQSANNYQYDAIGNLIKDDSEEISNIQWTVYGKVGEVIKKAANGQVLGFTRYRYDGAGNRIQKTVLDAEGTIVKKSHYIRDASGNVMGIYEDEDVIERPIYGSSRVGVLNGKVGHLVHDLGDRQYELSNHLGNVLATVSDKLSGTTGTTDYEADVLSESDYYPFGLAMENRKWGDDNYRHGFNGKENDSDFGKSKLIQDYGFRLYSPVIAKFLSVDPLTANYSWYTPYQFAGNKPIRYIDLDGLEEANPSNFTKAINAISGDFHVNRMNKYLTENDLTSENVIQLANDTYVVYKLNQSVDGNIITSYSIFRKLRETNKGLVHFLTDSDNDDIELSEDAFLKADVLGAKVLDSPFGGGSAKGAKVVLNGGKNIVYTFRQFIGVVQEGAKALGDWKSAIKFGIADATGVSRDLLKKGFHIHFKQLKGLELGLKPTTDGKVGLSFIMGKQDQISKAVKTFNQAMSNENFRTNLLVNLKASQEALIDASKVLSNKDEIKMAVDKAHEINYLIDAVKKYGKN